MSFYDEDLGVYFRGHHTDVQPIDVHRVCTLNFDIQLSQLESPLLIIVYSIGI